MTKGSGRASDLVSPALARISAIENWRLKDWDVAIRQARRAGLLARLAWLIDEAGLGPSVPERARGHLEAAQILARKHASDVARELDHIGDALAGLGVKPILLKGASYAAKGLPPARGRLFGDIDILVPKRLIAAAETALSSRGWQAVKQDAYDQSYYRRWMHELPPLQHKSRRTTIDVHHNIVPPTSAHPVDAKRMIDAAKPAGTDGRFAVLAPEDMVLHAAVHLFDDGEFVNGLRDLDDINRLLRHFAESPDFWDGLTARAASLRLERPLHYALRYAARFLGTKVPPRILRDPVPAPAPAVAPLMDFAFERGLRPLHPSCGDRLTGLALGFLYLRGHCLRMPLRLLLPHLLRKAVMRRLKPAEARPA
jgi:Uncharacterised nucleotidyltransferase